LTTLPSQQVVRGGGIGSVNDVAYTNVASTNLASWTTMGIGLGSTSAQNVFALTVSPTGELWAGGRFQSAGSRYTFPDGLARWTGASWVSGDINLFAAGTVRAIEFAPDGGMYIGGTFAGIGTAASVLTFFSMAGAATYPTIRMTAPASGTARVFQLLNTYTKDALYFDLVLQRNEQVTVSMRPGSTTITSTFRGNIISALLPGSNIAKWRLLPGTNYISFFADNTSLRTDFFHRPRFWSNDDII
jgi:hypothetical protein